MDAKKLVLEDFKKVRLVHLLARQGPKRGMGGFRKYRD